MPDDRRRPAASSRTFVDVTSLVDRRGPAHGITRLLSKMLGELATRLPHVELCTYDQGRRTFRVVRGNPGNFLSMQSAAADARSSLGLQIERPAPPAEAVGEPRSRLVSRLYFSLDVETRGAARRGAGYGRAAAGELGKILRNSYRPRASLRGAIGAAVAFAPHDTLLQWGALWGQHGIADELRRLQSGGIRIVSLVYDIIPVMRPEFFEAAMAARFAAWARATLETSESLIAISETTRRDLHHFAKERTIRCPSVSVLRLGDDSLTSPPETIDGRIVDIAREPFVLSLGTVEIRKNHRLLYQVWRRLVHEGSAPRLVIVGQRGWLAEETEALFLRDSTLRNHVALVRGADDACAAWLLSRTLFTVYPSLYEGWGLPVAESLSAGRMVVASDAAAVREAGQGLAIHLPSDDVPLWTHTIRELWQDPERRRSQEKRIAADMKRRSWSQAAADLAELLADLQSSRWAPATLARP